MAQGQAQGSSPRASCGAARGATKSAIESWGFYRSPGGWGSLRDPIRESAGHLPLVATVAAGFPKPLHSTASHV
jgi:hypothetical protein